MAEGLRMGVSVDGALRGFQKLGASVKRSVPRLLEESAKPVLEEARNLCPEGQGKLKKSLKIFSSKGRTGIPAVQIGSDLSYAASVERGAKPHSQNIPVLMKTWGKFSIRIEKAGVMVSKEMKYLKDEVWVWISKHPGIKGSHFLQRALKRKGRQFVKRFIEGMQGLLTIQGRLK